MGQFSIAATISVIFSTKVIRFNNKITETVPVHFVGYYNLYQYKIWCFY